MKRSSAEISSSSPSKNNRVRLLLHAVDGCVPYLTPSVLERHFPPSDDFWIGMAVRNTSVVADFNPKPTKQKKQIDPRDIIKDNGNEDLANKKPRGYTFDSIEPDPWLLPYTRVTVPTFDLLHDNETHQFKAEKSLNTNKQVSIWTPHGRQKINTQLYAKASSGLKSQYTLSLYDMNEDGTDKRKEKAESRNNQWFRELSSSSENLLTTTSSMWYPVLLPSTKDDKITPLSNNVRDDVTGIALIGRWWDDSEGLKQQLQQSLKFKDHKHVAVLATHTLKEILDVASTGIVDVIGTDLPSQWAKKKLALGFDIPNESSNNKRTTKEVEAEEETTTTTKEKQSHHLDSDGCMDMNDERYARDIRPLVEGCMCLSCANNEFSRAYVHHLVKAKELLAEILLFGHNLHHLIELIRAFNNAEDKEKYKDAILIQLRGQV